MKNENLQITIIFLALFFFGLFGLAKSSWAATYWVSPTGSASWSGTPNCQSTNDPGSNYCALGTATYYAQAGDTVYLKGGEYDVGDEQYGVGFEPRNSGSCLSPPCYGGVGASRIIFSNAPNEAPVIEQTGLTYGMIGLSLPGRSWIKITGITFKDFTYLMAFLGGGSSYNEISYCTFINDPAHESGAWFSIGGFDGSAGWSTNNWLHHNYFSKRRDGPCGEAIDMIRVGNAESSPPSADNYNTVESNYIEYAGHATLFTTGKYLVIKNNIAHNEPWIQGCTNYLGITSSTSNTIGNGSKTFTTNTGLGWGLYSPVAIVETSNYANAMNGMVTSYNSGTGVLVVNISSTTGSGTYSDWTLTEANVPYYMNPAYNGLYGHRNFAIGDADPYNRNYALVEGNRIGNASVNPGNGGSSNLDLESPGNIARYNYVFNGMNSGIYFKWANGYGNLTGGTDNRVYNNTSYHNGYGWDFVYGGMNVSYSGRGIAQFNYPPYNPTLNVVKNNISYGNGYGDICALGLGTPCTPSTTWDSVDHNWCTDSSSGCTAHGDPHFANSDVTNPLSQNLFPSIHGYGAIPLPDLSLTSNSVGLIDGGTHLTTANGSGSNSTTLVVQDALYFQDGSWGSDLARGVTLFPDWIAIGTVNNTVQIAQGGINYSANTITLASPMTWGIGANIWLYKKSDGKQVLYGAAPDYGAFEYGQNGDTTPPAAPRGLAVN